MKHFILANVLAFLFGALVAAQLPAAEIAGLARRGSAGVSVGPAEGETSGVVIRNVQADSAAARAGLREGDIVTRVAGAAVATPNDFVAAFRGRKVGEKMVLDVVRDGRSRPIELVVGPFALEKSDEFDIIYSSTSADGARYRTIYTKPKKVGRHPLLFIVHGVGCGAIDNPPPGASYTALIREVTLAGFATLRVDKPGSGDSEGGPCRDASFAKEVGAFRAALRDAKRESFIDPDSVFLFGHSMGGVMAPLLVPGKEARGVVVYGTTFKSWMQYTLDNIRRQMRLAGESFEAIGDEERASEKFTSLFYVEKWPLEKILEKHAEYREAYPDPKSFAAGKNGAYFQEIYDLNLAREWKKVESPVMAVWGASDFVSAEDDHEWLAAAVDKNFPGNGKFVRLEGSDHWLRKAADRAASMRGGPAAAEYNPALEKLLIDFMRKQLETKGGK
jgi:pimeloyl-ACP methyl ester carboxylesterase